LCLKQFPQFSLLHRGFRVPFLTTKGLKYRNFIVEKNNCPPAWQIGLSNGLIET
jgi:hypothetical protein